MNNADNVTNVKSQIESLLSLDDAFDVLVITKKRYNKDQRIHLITNMVFEE